MATTGQIRAIQSLRRRIEGFDEVAYRAKLSADFRVVSTKDLDAAQAGRLIEELKRLAGQGAQVGKRSPKARADAPKLQALWMSLYELGAVRSRDDAALIAFVKRMTGKEHPRFLTQPEANRCVEALKQWAEREGVSWTPEGAPKTDVCRAITRKLVAEGGFTPLAAGDDPWPTEIELYAYRKPGLACPASFRDYRVEHWDRLMAALGKRLRGVRAGAAKVCRRSDVRAP